VKKATEARLWYAQRLSAMVLALCVIIHLGTMMYAARRGLTAGAILDRTHGSVIAGTFYSLFVIACAIHVPIGLAQIAQEWLRWRGRLLWVTVLAAGVALLALGLRAVWALVFA
jgi:fumarate reductase subunit C